MGKQVISIGVQDFGKLRERKAFYVDKTDFIKEWWENQDDVTLITRPRRFGKTLTMSTVEYFFSNQYAGRGELFEGLSIWKEAEYRELQGSYPVISLSFADIKGSTYEAIRRSIVLKLEKLYSRFHYIKDSEVLNESDRKYFEGIGPEMGDDTASVAILYLSDYLSRYYGKKVLILLDEYDTPLQEAYVHGYWGQLVGFIRGLFNSTFKTNPYLEKGILTGITRVGKESIFSDLNNLEVLTTTSGKYESCFGFTEEEVFQALDQMEMSEKKDEVKQWYDGFVFGKQTDIYNPWSITKYLDSGKLDTYWAATSENSLVSRLIKEGSSEIKVKFEDLLDGKEIVAQLDEQIVFEQLQRKKGAIWSLLLASGYLKVIKRDQDRKGRYDYHLKITNHEVMLMFEDMVEDWFPEESTSYGKFVKALLLGEVDYMNQYMNQVAVQTFSSFDTGEKPSEYTEPERFYHGFVLGLIVDLRDQYRITSNRESGFGRYDVVLEPYDKNETAIVMEFKVFNPLREKELNDTAENALRQIEEKGYDTELKTRGFAQEKIRHYGLAFQGKRVLIVAGKQAGGCNNNINMTDSRFTKDI